MLCVYEPAPQKGWLVWLWKLEGLCDLDWDGDMVLLNKYNGSVWDLVID
jgi:hypothetical protein